jgi:hypothetical protein
MSIKKDVWISSQALKGAKLIDEAWIAGFGLALAEVQRNFGIDASIVEVCGAAGLTMNDFKKAGLEEYDLKVLRKCLQPQRSR